MSDNKKYYYIKLKDNFFDADEVKILESMPNGYLYSNLLLKLMLKSVKNNGCLQFNDTIPYNEQMISTVTGLNIDVVRMGLKVLAQLGLIEKMENGNFYMMKIEEFVGTGSSEGDRKSKYRKRISDEKLGIMGHCPGEVPELSEKCPPEIELKTKREKEIFLSDSNEYRLADYLRNYILKINPGCKVPNDKQLQTWSKTMDLLLRVDKRDIEDAKQLIRYLPTNQFWQSKILSADSLRKHYDMLAGQMNQRPKEIIKIDKVNPKCKVV